MSDFAERKEWVQRFTSPPYTSWERAQNEQYNDLFRTFVLKGISMENFSAEYIPSDADELNVRYRRKLGYFIPEILFDTSLNRVFAVDSKAT